ncbi:MAG: hypothetical protein N3E49_06395 [Bacteroidia bacterium]|nr:hypothetical protein [Bacteroidia bacterium]
MKTEKRYLKPLLLLLIAIVFGGVSYELVRNKSTPDTALACGIIWVALGIAGAISLWMVQTGSIRKVIYATFLKVGLSFLLIAGIALWLRPTFEPFLLCAVLAVVGIQVAHVLFSL